MFELGIMLWFVPVLTASAMLPEPLRPVLVLGLPLLYCLPWFIAVRRHHPQVIPIAILTLALGWTGIVWIITLAWSCSRLRTPLQDFYADYAKKELTND